MKSSHLRFRFAAASVCLCALLLLPPLTSGQEEPSPSAAAEAQPAQAASSPSPSEETPKLSNDQLDSLVAPIALYPDPLLAQTLAASTYPLEIVQLQQWLAKNKSLKGKALSQAVGKQDWDPSIQATAAFPDVVKRLADNIQWTTDLGNAFMAQQSEVMDAVQRMRAKAQDKGTLKTTSQQKVSSTSDTGRPIIKIEQASPEVVYVPVYDPTVVYGPPVYPYPPIWYPPPGYFAAGLAIGFADAVFLQPWAWDGPWAWGWNCGWGWGGGFININIHNHWVYNWNKNHWHDPNGLLKNDRWQHDPAHRGGAPYTRASARQVEHEMREREQARSGSRAGAGDRRDSRLGQGGAGERRTTRPGEDGSGERHASRLGEGGAGEHHAERERSHSEVEHERARGDTEERAWDRMGMRRDEAPRENFARGDGDLIGDRHIGREFGGGGDAFGGGQWRDFGGDRMRDFSMRGGRSLGGFGGGGFRGFGRR